MDQYYALYGISLPANGSMPVDFSWDIPSFAFQVRYKVATFFTVAHKFNLLGLPFTDDVVGNTAAFKVSGGAEGTVGFKKDAVTVDGEQYHFAAFPPREPASGPVTVEAIAHQSDQSKCHRPRHLDTLPLERQTMRPTSSTSNPTKSPLPRARRRRCRSQP